VEVDRRWGQGEELRKEFGVYVPSATDSHGSDERDELECDEEGFEALSVP
jgi:hypothetical protein